MRQAEAIAGVTKAAPLTFNLEESGFKFGIDIYKKWEGLPGKTLRFRCRMYLSGALAAKRETTIGLREEDRSAALIDFRMLILADVLIEPPMMIGEPQPIPPKKEGDSVTYTKPEWEVMPGFPEEVSIVGGTPSRELSDRAYAYLAATDGSGNKLFYFLCEDVTTEYWRRAIPRDFFLAPKGGSAADSEVPSTS